MMINSNTQRQAIKKQKNRFRFWALFLILLLAMNGLAASLFAQERVRSLTIRQFEIEEAIRNGLKYYLDPKDYVLRVKLFGEERAASVANEALPGFGQLNQPSTSTGEKFWEISRMRVDLVMHKEVSPSVNTYIGEIVPILSGLDYERGDEFIFVPIVPNNPLNETMDSLQEDYTPEAPPVISRVEESKTLEKIQQMEAEGAIWEQMSLVEKILAFTLLFFLLLLILVFWKLHKVQSAAEEQAKSPVAMGLPSPQQALDSIAETRERLMQNQEVQVKEAMVSGDNERLIQEVVKQLIGRADWRQELISEMSRDKQSMDQLTQLIATLGTSASRKLFAGSIPQKSYLELEELAREANPTPEDSNTVLKDIRMFLLTKQLADPEKGGSNPFRFMEQLSTGQIGFLVKDEPAKIKAIVVSRMDSEEAAQILHGISKDERTMVALELGKMHELPLELVEQVGFNLAEKARHVPDEDTVGVDGIKFVADVLSDSDPVTRQELISGLRTSDLKLSEDIENRCFIFDSIPAVPKDILLEVVRQLPPEDVITAISGATKEIQETVILCFPEQSRKALISSLKSKSPSSDEIRSARKLFVQAMRDMSEADRLDLKEVNSQWAQISSVPALEMD